MMYRNFDQVLSGELNAPRILQILLILPHCLVLKDHLILLILVYLVSQLIINSTHYLYYSFALCFLLCVCMGSC